MYKRYIWNNQSRSTEIQLRFNREVCLITAYHIDLSNPNHYINNKTGELGLSKKSAQYLKRRLEDFIKQAEDTEEEEE